jgi:hypothetical protein
MSVPLRYIPRILMRPPNPLRGLPFLLGVAIDESWQDLSANPQKLALKEFAIDFFRKDIHQLLRAVANETGNNCPKQLDDLRSKMVVDEQDSLLNQYQKLCGQFIQTISEIENDDLLRRIEKIGSSLLPISELVVSARDLAKKGASNPVSP